MQHEIVTTRPKRHKKTAQRNLYDLLNTRFGKNGFGIVNEITIFKTFKGRYRAQAEVVVEIKQ